jgi:hypothetical protein
MADNGLSGRGARYTAHQVIRFPMGNHHDAFLLLEKVGDKESVPLLMNALKWQDLPEDEDDLLVCTTTHCLEALQSLTDHDAGDDHRAWKKWWAETGSELPPAHFHHRQISKKPLEEEHAAGIYH